MGFCAKLPHSLLSISHLPLYDRPKLSPTFSLPPTGGWSLVVGLAGSWGQKPPRSAPSLSLSQSPSLYALLPPSLLPSLITSNGSPLPTAEEGVVNGRGPLAGSQQREQQQPDPAQPQGSSS